MKRKKDDGVLTFKQQERPPFPLLRVHALFSLCYFCFREIWLIITTQTKEKVKRD